MCGILLNIGDEIIGEDHPALELIAHRGPDGAGTANFTVDGLNLGMGHRRLSIIDLSDAGRQPMSYADGRYWIVFNGEIYNYIEIRAELLAKGASFISSCDTEVILAAYHEWGSECLGRFNGMFAFVIFDSEKKTLFFARDRFGVKPLYYVNNGQSFRAASEIKQFLGMPGFSPEFAPEKLYHFLNSGDFEYDSGNIWKSVREIEPGEMLKIELGRWKPGDGIRPEKWYSPPFFETKLDISFEDAVSEFRRLLDDSVKLRLRSDVPLGFLLSGGLDSSTLVGLAHRLSALRPENLKTYSSCYDRGLADEREFISEMLKFTGAESCLHFPSPADVAESLRKVIWHNDLPVLHGSPAVHWLLYRKIKEENDSRKVIVEGQGGDEIMCGYGDFHWAYLNETMHECIPSFVRQLRMFRKLHREPWKIILRKFMRINFPSTVRYPASPILDAGALLGPNAEIPPIAVRREEPSVSALHRNRFTILRYILHNVDRNSMAHSREARVPFLDYRLVEFCLRLPSGLKISDGITKRVLRSASKELIPQKIFNRRDKQGYSSPISLWGRDGLKSFFTENLAEFERLPFVDAKEARASFRRYIDGNGFFDPVLWRIISVGIWLREFKIKV